MTVVAAVLVENGVTLRDNDVDGGGVEGDNSNGVDVGGTERKDDIGNTTAESLPVPQAGFS